MDARSPGVGPKGNGVIEYDTGKRTQTVNKRSKHEHKFPFKCQLMGGICMPDWYPCPGFFIKYGYLQPDINCCVEGILFHICI